MGGCPNPVEAEQIVKNEQLNDILREQAHITYMQSAESQLDANVYNTDLLIDYDHLTPSATYQTLDQMAANMEQGMTQDLNEN